jgi:16S rRNA (adenine1518-N6/adenine1519-N6)-dimethyltransferase
MARQPLGQHFLADAGWRGKILDTLPRRAQETWIEIGAGHGEMTPSLAGDGRRVIAIETDPRLAKRLSECVDAKPAKWADVEVVSADVLRADLGELAGGRFRVYGNLPYYITSPILHHLFRWAAQIESIHVLVQWEVAARIVARPGRREYGYLSVLSQFYAKPEMVLQIPPGAFRPPPRVRSALVRFTLPGEGARLDIADDEQFLAFIQTCFSQKRKTLRNNLRHIVDGDRVDRAIEASKLRPDARAEQLSLSEFAALFEIVRSARELGGNLNSLC